MNKQEIPAPYEDFLVVKPQWLDANGHMNVAFYMSAFDDGGEVFFRDPGIGWDYTNDGVGSVFIVNCKLDFHRELFRDDKLRITTQLVDVSSKLLHTYQCIYHAESEYLAASAEMLFMHIEFSQRKSAPMPETAQQRLSEILAVHKKMPRPPGLGQTIGIKK